MKTKFYCQNWYHNENHVELIAENGERIKTMVGNPVDFDLDGLQEVHRSNIASCRKHSARIGDSGYFICDELTNRVVEATKAF